MHTQVYPKTSLCKNVHIHKNNSLLHSSLKFSTNISNRRCIKTDLFTVERLLLHPKWFHCLRWTFYGYENNISKRTDCCFKNCFTTLYNYFQKTTKPHYKLNKTNIAQFWTWSHQIHKDRDNGQTCGFLINSNGFNSSK